MKIKFLGHSAFLITGSNGVSVLTDPFEAGSFGGSVGYDAITDAADIVTISHEHEDHAGISALPGQPLIVRSECQAKGIAFDVIPTFHDQNHGASRGDNRVFLFTIDGIRVAHFGDLGHPLSPKQVQQLEGVNVAMVPVGGKFTIGPSEAWELVKQFRPNIVIPMHFKTPKIGFPLASVEQFLEGKTDVQRKIGSEISLEKSQLPQPIQIVFLPPAN
jgi:L-ascorbate metabolism protein UlaG (beta-lactamase superfamily)